MITKLERLAKEPGRRSADPSTRIRGYLRKAEDTLEEERARVRSRL